jgi:hypothetical protein
MTKIYYRFQSTPTGYDVYSGNGDGFYVDTMLQFGQYSFGYYLDLPISLDVLDNVYPIVRQFLLQEDKRKCYVELHHDIREKIQGVMIFRMYNLFGSSVSGSYIWINPHCRVNRKMQVEVSYIHSGTAIAESLPGVFKMNLKKLAYNREIAVRALPYAEVKQS